jgi:hypothetical protein
MVLTNHSYYNATHYFQMQLNRHTSCASNVGPLGTQLANGTGISFATSATVHIVVTVTV